MIDECLPIYTNGPVNCQAYSNNAIEQTENSSPNIIMIYLYQPQMRIQKVQIKSERTISSLSRHYLKNMVFIYKGQILDKEKSFSFYEIQNGSKIAMIPEDSTKSNPYFQEKWLNITNDSETFDKTIELNINSDFRKELSRLSDIKHQRMEMKQRNHSFYVKYKCFSQNTKKSENDNFCDLYKKGIKIDKMKLNVDYEKDEIPSDQPLPIIW